jgi:two-component system, cell cycle sensor histidine kinase and response regulator CckA
VSTNLGSLLIVDDEDELIAALCETLVDQGYETRGVTSGEEAIEVLSGQNFDLLLSDIMMPGMDGIMLLRQALEIDPNLVGIMMTGQGTIQTAVEAMKTGAFDYVLKPFKLAELLPVLSRAMEMRRLKLENMQLRETVAIYDLTKAFAFSSDRDTILTKVAQAAVQQCEADESSIMLPTPEGDQLYVAVVGGKDRETILGERVRFGESISGWVAMNREPLLLYNKIDDARFAPILPRSDILSSISIPMLAGGKLMGVLNVNDTHRQRPLTMGKLRALSILAGIAAAALEAEELFVLLKESEQRYRNLVEFNPGTTYVAELNGGIRALYISPQVHELLGFSSDDLLTNPHWWKESIHDEDRQRVFDEMRRCLLRGETFSIEYRMATRDGKVLWVQDTGRPVWNAANGSLQVQGLLLDVTGRKRAEESLQASEAMNRLLIEESPIGIAIVQHNKLTFANTSFSSMFKTGDDESLLGLPLETLVVPEQKELMLRRQKDRLEGRPVSSYIEFRGLRRNGEAFDMEVWPKTIEYQGEPAVLFFVFDATESRSLRSQLLQAQKMEAVGTLAGGVAHDFNNILTVVCGFSELLLSEMRPDSPAHEDLQKIACASQRGADLVKRLLTFSRKAEAHPRPLNLNTELEEIKKLLLPTIPKMIEIDLHLALDLNMVNADPVQMAQVLMNLAVNAKDAMPEGGQLIIETENITLDEEYCSTRLEVKPGHYVLLTVSDTGAGMDKETVSRIFEPFFTTKKPGEGTGLGLATVYGIVKQHSGRISCYSEPNRGTTFKVYLPVLEVESAFVATQDERTTHLGGTETVLLVDDEEFIRDLGKRFLRQVGYTVLAAGNGQEGLDLYKKEGRNISLVVLDLIMPGMGGKQCLEQLLKIDPKVKVIIASGSSSEGRTRKIFESNAKGFVAKPFKGVELLKMVREVLDAL